VAAAVKGDLGDDRQGRPGGLPGASTSTNVQGEQQKKLDVLANDAMVTACEWADCWHGLASEELDEPLRHPEGFARGPYLLVFDSARRFVQHREDGATRT